MKTNLLLFLMLLTCCGSKDNGGSANSAPIVKVSKGMTKTQVQASSVGAPDSIEEVDIQTWWLYSKICDSNTLPPCYIFFDTQTGVVIGVNGIQSKFIDLNSF